MKLLRYILSVLFSSIILAGCAKFVDAPPPPNSLVPATVFSTDATAAAAVTNMYQSMVATSLGGGLNGISALSGLSADEIMLQFVSSNNALQASLYSNSLTENTFPPYWQDFYNRIYQANSVIEGITASTGISDPRKKQLIGEAEFIRAFSNFYLVNFYGDVPLATTTDYTKNQLLARTPAIEIYQHIIADLSDAQSKLNSDYLTASGTVSAGRVRVNKSVATAMLARVYLYTGKYDSAELAATSVISNSAYQLPNDLDSVFLANNNEAIWQLEAPNPGLNTADAGIFNLKLFGGPNVNWPLVLNKELVYEFESDDNRKLHWTDSVIVDGIIYYYPNKYKLFYTGQPATEYATLFRLAEQYLIRAEARAMQNDITGAQADLSAIRHRAGLPDTDAANQADLLTAILNERRFELFTENGHRWLDLKRTGKVDEVMTVATAIKGGTWNSYQQLYPIPLSEIKLDNKLTQNQGY